MTWIEIVEPENADQRLAALYRRVAGPGGQIDNILRAHSLRPHTLEGHLALYKNVLHHSANALPKWLLEALGVYASQLNGCDYCVAHHREGMRRAVGADEHAAAILAALDDGGPDAALEARLEPLFAYARRLTLDPAAVGRDLIEAMRAAGWSDGEILEVNQVVAYFGYANRTVLGLGVATEGETLGISPGGADDDWSHG